MDERLHEVNDKLYNIKLSYTPRHWW